MLIMYLFAAVLLTTTTAALAEPVPRLSGGCPSGYASQGSYCSPMAGSRPAIIKQGQCPSGFFTSGNYCVEMARPRR
jgi:hypothetical protein